MASNFLQSPVIVLFSFHKKHLPDLGLAEGNTQMAKSLLPRESQEADKSTAVFNLSTIQGAVGAGETITAWRSQRKLSREGGV